MIVGWLEWRRLGLAAVGAMGSATWDDEDSPGASRAAALIADNLYKLAEETHDEP